MLVWRLWSPAQPTWVAGRLSSLLYFPGSPPADHLLCRGPGKLCSSGLQITPPNLPAHDGDGPADSGTVLARGSGPGPDAERRAPGMGSNQYLLQSETLR